LKEIEKVLTLRQAASDIKFGRYFYDEIEQGVGQYFRSSILAEIDSLHLFAGSHPIRYGFYCMLAKRFPFAVYYLIEDKIAKVAAVLDLRRDPNWIQHQLNQRKS
jgi:hypothetical protein